MKTEKMLEMKREIKKDVSGMLINLYRSIERYMDEEFRELALNEVHRYAKTINKLIDLTFEEYTSEMHKFDEAFSDRLTWTEVEELIKAMRG